MRSFALIDYSHPKKGFANRDQTGGYGSQMKASGVIGLLATRVKSSFLRLPVLALGYIAAILLREGHDVKFYQGMPCGEDYVIIASSMTQYADEIELSRKIKEKYPRSKVGFINTFSRIRPDLFRNAADFIILGEPEWAFLEIAKNKLILDGEIEVDQQVPLEDLPYPAWNIFPTKTFSYFPSLPKRPFFSVLSSRGCPYGCMFCPYVAAQGVKWRKRSPGDVISEIKHLKKKFNVRSVLFRDPVFTMDMSRANEISERIHQEVSGLEWSCETRIDRLTPSLIDTMFKSGLRSINVGVESFDNTMLEKAGKKPIGHEHQELIIRHMNKLGIRVAAFYILGLLDDTSKSIQKNIKYAKQLNTFTAQFCLLTPFPGTVFYETVKSRLLTEDFSKYTEYEPVIRLDQVSPEDLTRLKNEAYNTYYFRLRWIMNYGIEAVKCISKLF